MSKLPDAGLKNGVSISSSSDFLDAYGQLTGFQTPNTTPLHLRFSKLVWSSEMPLGQAGETLKFMALTRKSHW